MISDITLTALEDVVRVVLIDRLLKIIINKVE